MQQTQTSNRISGFHHLAICTGDIKGQIDFFTDKLGMELQSMYWMHGVPDTWHAFLRLNDESSIAFVSNPQIKQIPTELGHTHSGNPGANSAAGTMQHVALKVDSYDELLDMRDRLRTKGCQCSVQWTMVCAFRSTSRVLKTCLLSSPSQPRH